MNKKFKPLQYEPVPINMINSSDPALPKMNIRKFEMGQLIHFDVILNGYRAGIEKWPSGRGFTMTFMRPKMYKKVINDEDEG